MRSSIHEIAVARLAQDPSLLPALASRLLGKPPPAELRPVDSTVRLANPEEVRPDLILAKGKHGPWDAVEVQRRIDRAKAHRWAILVALLRGKRRSMGDLWVITASRRVAEWARTACDAIGPSGTVQRVIPVVLLLSLEQVGALLDKGKPTLAFFAAWAMQSRHGAEAVHAVERALEVTDELPDALRRDQRRDIMSVLNDPMVTILKEKVMDATSHLESRWVREWREEMEARAKQQAVLTVLEARGLPVSTESRAQIVACTDHSTLDRLIAGAVSTSSVDELLRTTPAPPKKTPPEAASRRAAPKKKRPNTAA